MDKRDAPLYLILHLRILEIAIYLFCKHEAAPAPDAHITNTKQTIFFCHNNNKTRVICLLFIFKFRRLILLSVWLPPILLLAFVSEYFSNMRNRGRGSQCQQNIKAPTLFKINVNEGKSGENEYSTKHEV